MRIESRSAGEPARGARTPDGRGSARPVQFGSEGSTAAPAKREPGFRSVFVQGLRTRQGLSAQDRQSGCGWSASLSRDASTTFGSDRL